MKRYPDNQALKYQFEDVKAKLRSQIRKDKKDYYSKQIDLCGNDSAKYWRLIKNVTHGPMHEIKAVEMNNESTPVLGNEVRVANASNEYFSTVNQRLVENSNPTNRVLPPISHPTRFQNSFVCTV